MRRREKQEEAGGGEKQEEEKREGGSVTCTKFKHDTNACNHFVVTTSKFIEIPNLAQICISHHKVDNDSFTLHLFLYYM